MGFVSEELNETEKQLIKDSKASNMAVVYGKEASIWKVSPSRSTALPTVPSLLQNGACPSAGHTHSGTSHVSTALSACHTGPVSMTVLATSLHLVLAQITSTL